MLRGQCSLIVSKNDVKNILPKERQYRGRDYPLLLLIPTRENFNKGDITWEAIFNDSIRSRKPAQINKQKRKTLKL